MKKPDKTAEAYKAIKAALKASRENVRYFTLAFYKTYMQCRAKADDNIKAGIDDSYIRQENVLSGFTHGMQFMLLIFTTKTARHTASFWNLSTKHRKADSKREGGQENEKLSHDR